MKKEKFEEKTKSTPEEGQERFYRQVSEQAKKSLIDDLMIIKGFKDKKKKKEILESLKELIEKELEELE